MPFSDSPAEPNEILQRLLSEALESPETFGPIRIFRFKALANSMLIAVPAASRTRGILALYLGDKRSAAELQSARQALKQFLPRYVRALSEPIEDSQFIEVAAENVRAEMLRTRSELIELPAEVLMYAFEAKPIGTQPEDVPAESSEGEPAASLTHSAGPDAAGASDELDDQHLNEAMFAFAERVLTPGLWHTRPKPPVYSLAEKLPVFSLIASNVLADFLPLRCTEQPVRWDEVGVEVYGIDGTEATYIVLYTGDPTAVFSAVSLPPGLPEVDVFAIEEDAHTFAIECGLPLGRPEPPPEDAPFYRVTDPEEIRRRFRAGLATPQATLDILTADDPGHRPTDLSFDALAAWALGAPPEALRITATGRAPAINKVKVFRHREHPLGTVVAVVHSGNAALSVGAFCPIDVPDEAWPEIVRTTEGADYNGPDDFELLSGAEGEQQLRRALVALEAEGGISESYNVFGLPTPEVNEALARAVSEERAAEFEDELLSFSGLVQTWVQHEEEQITRPPSFIARHEEDPHLLLLGGASQDDTGFRMYLVADALAELDPLEVIERLGEADPDATLEEVLDAAGFEVLDAEAARDELIRAVGQLTEQRAELYDLEQAEVIH